MTAEFFSIEQNRTKTVKILDRVEQKVLVLRSKLRSLNSILAIETTRLARSDVSDAKKLHEIHQIGNRGKCQSESANKIW